MANTPKPEETKEIIGMNVPGIEDYTNDFDEHSDSSKDHEISISMSHKTSMIRHSFNVLLPIGSPNTSVKLGLPLSVNDLTDDESDYEISTEILNQQTMIYPDQKIEEEPPTADDIQLFNEFKKDIEKQKQMNAADIMSSLPTSPETMHKKQHSVLELDEDSTSSDSEGSTSSDSDTDNDDSGSYSDDADDTDNDDSSTWGNDSEEFDEGMMTYFVMTAKPDPNATKFALTPFESVVEEASKKLDNQFIKIKYPTGSKFHSQDLLATQDYHKLQNVQLVKWIKNDPNEYDIKSDGIKYDMKMKSNEDIFEWLKKGINEVYTFYRGKGAGTRDLNNCFNLISDIFEFFEGDSGDAYRLMLRADQREDYRIFKLFELLLHTFARLSCRMNNNRNILQTFYHFLEHTKKIFPTFRMHLELLKETHAAHIDSSHATHCMKTFVSIFNKSENYLRSENIPMFELCVKSLVALDLYMENYSPLNHSILSDRATYDINSESFKWLDDYNRDCDSIAIQLCSNPQSRIEKLIAKYEQFRGFSFLRARVSWVIGHSQLYHQRKFYTSEKYFFEALYCLKTLSQHEFFPLNRTMHTELASLVLIDYADVLLENKKYPYAIVALEKVIECLEERGKYDRKFQIVRKLCITCTETGDWNRAIKYHNITLQKLKDNYLNLNEFVYLSQQISTIHLKLNNFNQSEKEIQNGIKTIYKNVLSYHNNNYIHIDNNICIEKIFEHCEGEERVAIGSLILVLANLYISGGNYLEIAISLLEYLKKKVFTNPSEARRLLILFQLARAYFKNGRYKMADDIIENRILCNYSTKNKELLTSLEFIQLRVLICINCGDDNKFEIAFELLDEAIKNERKESFVRKAKINYLKGKVLQAKCFEKLIKKYEFNKQQQFEFKDGLSINKAATTLLNNNHHHDIPTTPATKPTHRRGGHDNSNLHDNSNPLEGAISSLLISHGSYKSMDPIMQTKCCLELSKTYLEIIMEYYAIPKFVLQNERSSVSIIQWLGQKIFNDFHRSNSEIIAHCLDEIYRPLYTALSLSKSETKDILLLIESYISLAEFEFLKENYSQTSKNFWKQSKITFFATYRDSNDWIFLRRIDRHSRLQIFKLFKRILRLLICYENKFVAANVEIFVSYISLETFMIAQKDILIPFKLLNKKMKFAPRKSNTMKPKPKSPPGADFSRYTSTAIYKQNSDILKKDDEKDDVTINPTVTFRISDEQNEGLSHIQLGNDISGGVIRPLYQRYLDRQSLSLIGGELYLDELFRMHWKMRTESSQFSGARNNSSEIDNNKSLVTITKCIHSLRIEREHNKRCWNINETFIISLNSIVFIFHPHTLFKYGIHNNNSNKHLSKKFQNILKNIAFHDNDYLQLKSNPWIEQKSNINKCNKTKLNVEQNCLLLSELSLPYLKLESVKELLMCLDPQNILNLLSSMFSECQIILISRERCRCIAIMDALFVLMYPFSWQYPIIEWLSPPCFELLNLPIPFIFGVANISQLSLIINNNQYDICDRCVIINLDTNNVIKPLNNELKPHQLPMKIKSKLTRAMFRLMSGFLKNAFITNNSNSFVFPPRRRDMIFQNIIINDIKRYKLLKLPNTGPISSCSERKQWYTPTPPNHKNESLQIMIIHFQKEFATAFVEVLEQYRLFWVNINSALHKDLKLKSNVRIQKYAHPRYRKFVLQIQKTRMFSSFQCIRSLANNQMLNPNDNGPLFDNLVMKSLKWRQSLYHDIIQQQQQEIAKMKVSIQNCKKRYFINHLCTVKFEPKTCVLKIIPLNSQKYKPFEVYLNATVYELESDHVNKLHPYIDPKQVKKYGERYQFTIKHQTDGILTLNCQSYYELTRWIHVLRAHSMDTWAWFFKF